MDNYNFRRNQGGLPSSSSQSSSQHQPHMRGFSAPAGTISSAWLDHSFDEIRSRQTDEVRRQMYRNQAEQKQKEEIMIANMDTCTFARKSELAYKLSQIDGNELKNMTDTQFYNANLMSAVMCMADVVYHGNDQSYMNERVRAWITGLRQIGAKSVSGIALRANFDDADQLFIVKAPRSGDDTDLVHELFVGLYGTNKLRTENANFAMLHGGFKCTAPLVDEKNKEVVTWCNRRNDSSINYVLYENVAPGVDMATYIKTCSPLDYLNKFMQALYSLHLGNIRIDFTHYDAHTENAIIRKVSEFNEFYLPYTTEKGTEYLKSNGVLTWIDYGTSHIAIPQSERSTGSYKEGFGTYLQSSHGADAQESYPLFDAFKFLGFSMYNMMNEKRWDLFQMAARLLRYFTNEEPRAFITQQREGYFSLPREPGLVKRSLLDFTTYIRKWVPEANYFMFDTPPRDAKVLGCITGQCQTLDSIISNLGMSDSYPQPKTLVEAADIIRQLPVNDELARQSMRDIIGKHYRALMYEGREQFDLYIQDIKRTTPMKILSVDGASPEAIFTQEMLQTYREYILTVGRLIELFQRTKLLIASGLNVQTFLNIDTAAEISFIEQLGEKYQHYEQHHVTIDKMISAVQVDYDYLLSLSDRDQELQKMLNPNGPYNWYLNGIRTIIYATST